MGKPAISEVYTSTVRALLGLLIAGWFAAWPAAQAPTAPTTGAAAATPPAPVTQNITAVVTDRRGQALGTLKPADFEVSVDGKPQPVTSADLRTAAANEPRTLAFLLDEFHTAAADSAAVRDSLLRFVDQHVRDADRVIVLKPLDPLTQIRPMADRDAVRQAIASFEGRKGDFAPRTAFERNYMAQTPEAVAWARAAIVTSAVRAISASLAEAPPPGRAAIVLVGDGFERVRSSREVPANLQTTVRIANRAAIAVYAFAPSPQPVVVEGAKPDPAYEALRMVTSQTGGTVTAGVTQFEGGLALLLRDLGQYYVLAYEAAHGEDGRYHTVSVTTKRAGASVRARGGYVAPVSAAMRAAATPTTSAIPLRVMRRSALIQSWAGAVPIAPGRARVMLTWEPASPRPGTTARGRAASIVITAASADGTVLFDAATGPVGAAAGEDSPDHAAFDAPVGPVRIDMKILDQKGIVIDTDARDMVVAAPKPSGPTLYTPAVVRTQSAREFRLAVTNPDAAPAPSREFRRTERLLIRVAATAASGAPGQVTAVLLNRMRQPMRTLPPLDGDGGLPSVVQFDLPLAALAPGDYAVQLSATDGGTTTAEYVTFRIIG